MYNSKSTRKLCFDNLVTQRRSQSILLPLKSSGWQHALRMPANS